MKLNSVLLQNKFLFCACLIFSICGFALIGFYQTLFDFLLTLREGSLIYKFWKVVPIDLKTEFYLFNWTNSEDFYNHSVKPKFEETGPYRFWQREVKANITWNDNGTVTFKQIKHWYYDTKEKNGNLSDKIISIKTIPLGASFILRNWNYYVKKGLFVTLHPYFRQPHSVQTARELLYEGYSEPLIKVARALPIFAKNNLPNWDRFGWIYGRNGSSEFDGTFNMGTGSSLPFGEAYAWEGHNRTPFYDGQCAAVYGSAGQFFARNLKKDVVRLFSSDLRRSNNLTFQREETVSGILGYKYIADDRVLDNGTIYPQNACFCNGQCLPSGTLNLSNTRHGFPLFLSMPHFYRADPYYNSLIDGLKPDPKRHEFSMVIEPTTGIPIKVDAKIQANLLIQPISGVLMYEDAPRFMLPVIWTHQSYQIEGFHAFLVWLLVHLSSICVILGITVILCSVSTFAYITYRKQVRFQEEQKCLEFFKEEEMPLNTVLKQT